MVKILTITASQTYELRLEVLRPGMALQDCQWQGDNDATTAHFGVCGSSGLLGVASIYQKLYPAAPEKHSYQLRGMATKAHARGSGHGQALLEFAEAHVGGQGGVCIWANARVSALDFYLKFGYQTSGSEFVIDEIGSHMLIYKCL